MYLDTSICYHRYKQLKQLERLEINFRKVWERKGYNWERKGCNWERKGCNCERFHQFWERFLSQERSSLQLGKVSSILVSFPSFPFPEWSKRKVGKVKGKERIQTHPAVFIALFKTNAMKIINSRK